MTGFQDKSPAEIKRYHLDNLINYIWFSKSNTDFYQNHLKDTDVDGINSLDDFRNQIPTVTKSDFLTDQESNPPYGTRLSVPEREIVKVYLTSGTSGAGREIWGLTRNDLNAHVNQLHAGFDWIGISSDDVIFNTRPIGVTAGADWFPRAFDQTDANVFNVGSYSTEEKIRLMDRFDATVVLATPPYLKRLAVEANNLGIDLTVDTLLTASDSFTVPWVTDIEKRYSGTLFEEYGVTEGASLWTCKHGAVHNGSRGTIHFYPEFCYYEVVDPDRHSEHVDSGEIGELIITPFCRRGMPVVRFATGDRVKYIGPNVCPCDLPFGGIESGTIGRYDNVIRIKGRTIWPQTIDDIVFSVSEIREYVGTLKFDSDHRELAIIEVEFTHDLSNDEKSGIFAELQSEIQDQVGIRIQVSEADQELPDYASQQEKPDRWADQRLRDNFR